MRFRKTLTFLILATGLVFALSAWAQQKPMTQDQVQALVRDGFGDESGAKLIEQRGIDFAPAGDFLQNLKAAGASEAFLNALRTAKPSESAKAKKPLNQVQVFALLTGQVPSHRIAVLVEERGIDFEPTDDYLQEVRLAGGEEELLSALKSAHVAKPINVDPALQAQQAEVRRHAARGAELEKKGQFAEAEKEFRAALLIDSQNADLYASLAYVLNEQQKWEDAESAARAALRLNPNDEWAHSLLGIALGEKGDTDSAIAEFHEALRLRPDDENAHGLLGVALGRKGDWDGAIVEYREALRLNPKNDSADAALGDALGKKRDLEGAMEEYREALRLNPDNDAVHVKLGDALRQMHHGDESESEYRKALRLNPKNADAHFGLGSDLGTHDPDGAIFEFREVVRLNPKNADAHVMIGMEIKWRDAAPETELAKKGQMDGQLDIDSLRRYDAIAKKDLDEVIFEFREAVRLNPNNASTHYLLGSSMEEKGDRAGALEQYRAAYSLDPTDTTYKQNYEQLLRHMKK